MSDEADNGVGPLGGAEGGGEMGPFEQEKASLRPQRRKKRWDILPEEVQEAVHPEVHDHKRSRWDARAWDPSEETSQRAELGDSGQSSGNNPSKGPMSSEGSTKPALQREYTDEELDRILPAEGYEIVKPPEGYEQLRRANLENKRRLLEPEIPLYEIPEASAPQQEDFGEVHDAGQQGYMRQVFHSELGELSLKMEDFHFFAKIFSNVSDDDLSPEEVNERLVLTLLLKIKNGSSILRRKAMKQAVETARDKGPGIVLNSLLPLLMQSTLEEQERHILVKTLDRILQRLGSRVKPYVHKILVVIEPMLIDQDYYARQEGREIISNLAKAVGLATMIATMRPDIDHPDEYVRNTTAKAFAILASAMGIPSLVIFLQAVCQSKKSWQARHTGIRIVQQIAILHGSSVLPHLKSLVQIISHGLGDDNQKVRVVTALSLASLAEASSPYGIEAFEPVLGQIWRGISEYRSRNLASFLKAMGQIISLMEVDQACHYIREISPTLVREFASHDDEMKRVVLKVLEQCIKVEEIGSDFVKRELLGPFISQFWTPRNSLDKRTSRLVVNATVLLSKQDTGPGGCEECDGGCGGDSLGTQAREAVGGRDPVHIPGELIRGEYECGRARGEDSDPAGDQIKAADGGRPGGPDHWSDETVRGGANDCPYRAVSVRVPGRGVPRGPREHHWGSSRDSGPDVWLHCQDDWAAGCFGDTTEQSKGSGEAAQSLYYYCYSHYFGGLHALHGPPGPDERVQDSRPELHWGHVQGLHIRSDSFAGGGTHRQRPGPQANSSLGLQAPCAGSGRDGVQRRTNPPTELSMAQCSGAWAGGNSELPPPGTVPPGKEGKECILENLQYAIHWEPGLPGSLLP
ncbi:splicing factor 3B subunit1-like HEAT repeat-containing protein [Cryptosporidium canis]|uniref:Splicing factor 3B subunit1-like HEAT repeat-containing protein n=1 Tax=Cryptosporidium canis TaxID=195482 RepID=A0A9D5HWB2_9CRYT|nr:splicing factor 3B subunit1-like HEAT repeat-containing protein [Cryptosporidium canis]